MYGAPQQRTGVVAIAALAFLPLACLLNGGCPGGGQSDPDRVNWDNLGGNPLGLALAAVLEGQLPAPEDRAKRLLTFDEGPEDMLLGVEFENCRVIALLDETSTALAGILIENHAGETLYEIAYRFRGVDITLGTGDAVSLDVAENDTVRVLFTMNSTQPATRLALTISPDGEEVLDPAETEIFDTENPAYGLLKPVARASKEWNRMTSHRSGTRANCRDLLGGIRMVGSLACDASDLLSGNWFVQVPAALCLAGKKGLALAETVSAVRSGQKPLDHRSAAMLDASLTTLCKSLEVIGVGATQGLRFVSPVGIGCAVLTLGTDFLEAAGNDSIESIICWALIGQVFISSNYEIIGFRNLDGATQDTVGAVPDITLVAGERFGTDYPLIGMPVRPIATRTILTVVDAEGAESELRYWLATRGPAHFLVLPLYYGSYEQGVRGVQNAPYPAPPLTPLPACWHYRLRIRTDGPEEAELLFRVRPLDEVPDAHDCNRPVDSISLSGTTYVVTGVSNPNSATGTIHQPLAGVKVAVHDRTTHELLVSVDSGEDGRYATEFPRGPLVYVIASKAGYADFSTCHTEHSLSGEAPLLLNTFQRPANPTCTTDLERFRLISGAIWPGIGFPSLVSFGLASEGCAEFFTPYEGLNAPTAAILCVTGDKGAPTFHWNDDWVRDASGGNAVTSISIIRLGGSGATVFRIVNMEGLTPPIMYGDTTRGSVVLGADGSILLQPGERYKVILGGLPVEGLVFEPLPD